MALLKDDGHDGRISWLECPILRPAELLENNAGEMRILYSLRHTYAIAEFLSNSKILIYKNLVSLKINLKFHYSKLNVTLAAGRA